MSLRLLYMPGELSAQIKQPAASSNTHDHDFLNMISHRLQKYHVLGSKTSEESSPHLALSYITSFSDTGIQDSQLQSLLSMRGTKSISIALTEDGHGRETDDRMTIPPEMPLPPELQPVAQDDNLPWGNAEDFLEYEEDDTDYDAMDHKNMPDYDPDQESETYEDWNHAESWIVTNNHEVNEGQSRPRLYERMNISKVKTGVVYSKYYDDSEVKCK